MGALALTALGTSFAVASMNVLEVEFSEFPEETAAIVAATADLFDTVEAGIKPAPEIKRDRVIGDFVTPASARSDQARFGGLTDEHGPVKNLTGYRITWYPVDRFLGAVDYMGTWNGNRDLVCGHVTWDLSDPANPVLDEIEAHYVDISKLSTSPDAHQALLNANCAFGEIEQNFTVFETEAAQR